MALFAAGAALTALLFATYTTRHSWLACGSAVLSVLALIGVVFLATAKDRQSQERFAWLATQLEPVLDRQTLDSLTTAAGDVSAVLVERAKARAAAAPDDPRPIEATASAAWPAVEGERAPTAEPAAKVAVEPAPAPQAVSTLTPSADGPVQWLLDEPPSESPVGSGTGFRIGGINVSDQALTDVRGILKPDQTRRRLALTLDVEGRPFEAAAVIPPGAKFTLAQERQAQESQAEESQADSRATADGAEPGGAILTFRYSHGGQRKTKIVYLTAPMLARLADGAGGTP